MERKNNTSQLSGGTIHIKIAGLFPLLASFTIPANHGYSHSLEGSMRRKIVAGNWKMHASKEEAKSLIQYIQENAHASSIEIVIFPSFVHLPLAESLLKASHIKWGAQNFYPGNAGAFTGEVSGPMLVNYGCHFVLIGHSERRQLFQESLDLVAAKFQAALQYGLQPVLCVGETLEQRQSGETREIIQKQLHSVIELVGIKAFDTAVIAYEPVWAIGTGLTATPLQAQEVHEFIRNELAKYDEDLSNCTRILYGGSVKADNAAGLFAMSDIDGGLVGGASLEARGFLEICQAACL